MEYIKAKRIKEIVDVELNNGKSFTNVEYLSASPDGLWQKFKLQNEMIANIPTLSIAYMINVNTEIVTEDED